MVAMASLSDVATTQTKIAVLERKVEGLTQEVASLRDDEQQQAQGFDGGGGLHAG
jgi:hypothetical protein